MRSCVWVGLCVNRSSLANKVHTIDETTTAENSVDSVATRPDDILHMVSV